MDKKRMIAEKMSLPQDIIFGEMCVYLLENNEVWIENYKGILDIGCEKIVVKGKNICLSVSGCNLKISYYTNEQMKIVGKIVKITFCE